MSALVVNLGLKSIRAIAFDPGGRKLASAARPVRTFLKDERIEQDADEWWQKLIEVVGTVVEETGPDFDFVTITASSACLVPVSESGRPLSRAIMVSDRRAVRQAARMGAMSEFEAVTEGNSTFAPDPYFLLPKAMWLLDHDARAMEEARWLMTPADFLAHKFTGVCATDPLNAEKFYFDVETGTYPEALMRSCGVDARMLPPVLSSGETLGSVHPEAEASTGVRSGVPVILSTYDAICAFWGSGVSEVGDVADVSGTVTSIRMLHDQPMQPDEQRVFSQNMPGIDHLVVGGSNSLGGGLVEWLKQSLYGDDASPYDSIAAEAAESGAGARGILFLPYLLGERCPVWDPEARGVFFGLERQHQRGDFARAVCEGAAFSVEHVLAVLRENGARPQRLRVSGGLARLGVVNEIKADVTGLPTEVLTEFETTAVGAMMIAGKGFGWFDSIAEAAAIVKVREIVLPDASRHDMYRKWFELYLRLSESMTDLYLVRSELCRELELGGLGRLENL